LSLFVDTSVWSLAFRRHASSPAPEVRELVRAIDAGEPLLTTGLVLQELLQGFSGPPARERILDRFSALPLLVPDRDDHIDAADCAPDAAVPAFRSVQSMRCSRSFASAIISRC
jgi:predicted nucleic acid-binding protein